MSYKKKLDDEAYEKKVFKKNFHTRLTNDNQFSFNIREFSAFPLGWNVSNVSRESLIFGELQMRNEQIVKKTVGNCLGEN